MADEPVGNGGWRDQGGPHPVHGEPQGDPVLNQPTQEGFPALAQTCPFDTVGPGLQGAFQAPPRESPFWRLGQPEGQRSLPSSCRPRQLPDTPISRVWLSGRRPAPTRFAPSLLLSVESFHGKAELWKLSQQPPHRENGSHPPGLLPDVSLLLSLLLGGLDSGAAIRAWSLSLNHVARRGL